MSKSDIVRKEFKFSPEAASAFEIVSATLGLSETDLLRRGASLINTIANLAMDVGVENPIITVTVSESVSGVGKRAQADVSYVISPLEQ